MSKGLMYISITPKGEAEGLLAFVVPTGQCCMALNEVHQDVGHQNQQRTLALAQERFWWPMMTEDCQALVQGCQHCCIFKGAMLKAFVPNWGSRTTGTGVHWFHQCWVHHGVNKPPSVKNVLVVTDHFMRYALAVVTRDQTMKTVVKILYKWFISVFGMPAKLLSDHGTNLTSTLVEELCTAFGIQKCWSTAYHAQCNSQEERFHQTLFRIRKLAMDKKVQWEQHLPKLLQAYNSTHLAVTGYLPHYLMLRRCLHLPVDYYFPTMSGHLLMLRRYGSTSRKLMQRSNSSQTAKQTGRSDIMIEQPAQFSSCLVMLSWWSRMHSRVKEKWKADGAK